MTVYFRDNIVIAYTSYAESAPAPEISAIQFENHIYRLLSYIAQRAAGAAVIDAIDRSVGCLTITSLEPRAANLREYIKPTGVAVRQWALQAWSSNTGGLYRDAPSQYATPTSDGRRILAEIPGTRVRDPGEWVRHSNIQFHPLIWPDVSQTETKGAGNRADEALLHEMVHSLRHLRGVYTRSEYGSRSPEALQAYNTFEEFACILVTNYYSAEEERPLRAGHHGYRTLEGGPEAWRVWPQDEHLRRLLRDFCDQQQELAQRLSDHANNPYEFDPIGHHVLLRYLDDPSRWEI